LAKEAEERKKAEEAAKAAAEAEANSGPSEEELREIISEYFTFTHTKCMELADQMLQELRRPYYITPSLFLELVKGYSKLLVDKQ